MTEQTFFEYDDVKVTSSRFITGGQTYAMSNITSVKPYEKKPSRFLGVVVLLLGLIVAMSSLSVGIVMVVCAGIYLYFQKSIYHILLSTSAGETKALVTYQRDYLDKVIAALNDAIVARG
jgi:Family of unknown function (DUF6232)